MTIEQARYIVEIVRCGTFRKAAQNLYVSQSAVSQAILALEQKINGPIFTRGRTGSALTSQGREVYKLCSEIVKYCDLVDDFGVIHDPEIKGKVSIMTANCGMNFALPSLISAYRVKWPGVLIEFVSGSQKRVIKAVSDGICDFAIISALNDIYHELSASFSCITLYKSKLSIAVSRKNKFAEKQDIKWDDLPGCKWALNSEDFAYSLQKYIPTFFVGDVLFYSEDAELILNAVGSDIVVSAFPDHGILKNAIYKSSPIKLVPFSHENRPLRLFIFAVCPKDHALSPKAADLLEMWKTFYSDR